MKPTIYITNRSSITADDRREAKGEARQCSGPRGQQYTIMARPRAWCGEYGDGNVVELQPDVQDLADVKRGFLTLAHYRWKYAQWVARWDLNWYAPGSLFVFAEDGSDKCHVAPESTLFCSCSRAAAVAGHCHRVWAAGLLLRAGWRVVLDGRVLGGVDAEGRPVWVVGVILPGMLPGMEG